jgi:hypothetical protein
VNDHVRKMLRLQPGRPALALGVRTALATVVPLVLLPWTGHAAAAWGSTAAFSVALADKGGPYRTRAATMGGVTLAAAVAATVAALAGAYAPTAVVLMFVVATACGFAGVLGCCDKRRRAGSSRSHRPKPASRQSLSILHN